MFSLTKKVKQQGFTLIEMMVSIVIFSLISGIVIFNHGKFNSSIVVTNLAYEVALALREAQVYGLAVKQDPNDVQSVEYAYGVYFDIDSPKVFYIFADRNGDQQFDPNSDPCNGSLTSECQEMIEIRGDVDLNSLKTNQTVDKLTILFLRPNPVAIIRDENNSSSGTSGRQRAVIQLHSSRADKSKEVVVELSGQVSVRDPE
jgi:prepilin-type N-terminal cleavage/methylation domain-containing protein